MSNTFNVKTWLIPAGVLLFFLSGTIYTTQYYKQFQMLILLLAIVLIWSNSGLQIPRYLDKRIIKNPYIYFVFSIVVSFFVHYEWSMIITIIGLLLILWVSYDLIPICYYKSRRDIGEIAIIIVFLQLLFVFISFAVNPVRMYRYRGIFTNQNGLGGTAATLCAVSIALFLENSISNKRIVFKHLIILGIIILLSVVTAIIATSRTSVLTIGGMICIAFWIMLKKGIVHQRKRDIFLLLVIIIIVISFIMLSTGIWTLFVNNIVAKFIKKAGSQLNGREVIWSFIFDRIRIFGNGETTSIAAHNTYFSMLDQYGVFAAFFWIVYVVSGVIKSWKLALSEEISKLQFLPLFSFLCFGVEALAEGMMLKTVMLLTVFSMSILSNRFGVYNIGISD